MSAKVVGNMMARSVRMTLLIFLLLAASPAIAEQKLFLSCIDGRDAQTNRPNLAYPNMNVVIDTETKTISLPSFSVNSFPISHIDDQTITVEFHRNIDPQSTVFVSFLIDRVKGRLAWTTGMLTNCQGPSDQPKVKSAKRPLSSGWHLN
jgi:hypothetical protein